jgi:hypothetical protein
VVAVVVDIVVVVVVVAVVVERSRDDMVCDVSREGGVVATLEKDLFNLGGIEDVAVVELSGVVDCAGGGTSGDKVTYGKGLSESSSFT